ncbi:MAG: hypothetical protein HC898_11810 [Phycisphaerales bacterium]|nr:hypothetical protein [Phycisphaerales bacterium]
MVQRISDNDWGAAKPVLNYFRKHLAHHRLALGVLLLVITATFLAAAMVHLHQTESQAIQQDNQTVQIRKTIEDHLRMYQQMIGTVRAVFLASEEVTADEWRMFLQSAGYPHNCAGMSSLGYVRRISSDRPKAVPSDRSRSESQSTDVYALTYLSLSDGRMLESSTNLAQFYQHRELLDQAALEGRSLMGTFWGHPRLDGRDPADASESQFLMPQWVIYEPIVEVLDGKTGKSRRIKGWVVATLDTRQMLQQLQGKLPGTKVTVPEEPWIATGVRSQLAAQCAQKANQQDSADPLCGQTAASAHSA